MPLCRLKVSGQGTGGIISITCSIEMEYLGSLHTASRIYIGEGTISTKNIQIKYTMAKTWFPKGGCLFIICIGA